MVSYYTVLYDLLQRNWLGIITLTSLYDITLQYGTIQYYTVPYSYTKLFYNIVLLVPQSTFRKLGCKILFRRTFFARCSAGGSAF